LKKQVRMAWMPAILHSDGRVENMIQGRVERKGPKKGRWAKKPKSNGMIAQMGGKRVWIDGQHLYNRQRNPGNPNETILGTRLMNTNTKMQALKDSNGNYISELVDDAKILRYGMIRPVEVTTQDDIAQEALAKTREVLDMKGKAMSEQKGVNSDMVESVGKTSPRRTL